jgi:hypothetical protein
VKDKNKSKGEARSASTIPHSPFPTPGFIELSLSLRADQQESVEAALEDVGALAVTLLDADADTSNEQAILEPGVGETPLWSQIVLTAPVRGGHRSQRPAAGSR